MRFVVIGILLALLAGAIFVGHYGWISAGEVAMPAWGWLMMGLGVFFTLVVGSGLMILIFYSSRAGYDEAPQIEYDEAPEGEPDNSAPKTTSDTIVPLRDRHRSGQRGPKRNGENTRIRA
jgi:hypothetical protein